MEQKVASEPAQGMQVLKYWVQFLPAAVYWLLGLCAIIVLWPDCKLWTNWRETAALPLRRYYQTAQSLGYARDQPCEFLFNYVH